MNHFLLHLAIAIALACVTGCQPVASSATSEPGQSAPTGTDDPPVAEGPIELPGDYAAAVQRITHDRDAIRSAVESGDLEKAHHPLDEADAVLRRLPEIARDSGVPRRYWEQIVVAGDDLGELWGEIHTAIDANQTPDYARVQDAIDDALRRLAEVDREVELSRTETSVKKP